MLIPEELDHKQRYQYVEVMSIVFVLSCSTSSACPMLLLEGCELPFTLLVLLHQSVHNLLELRGSVQYQSHQHGNPDRLAVTVKTHSSDTGFQSWQNVLDRLLHQYPSYQPEAFAIWLHICCVL